jgi:N-acetylglutamate synthase-like GNAT family acetyltransferase
MLPRLATSDDVQNIRALIERSARGLSVGFYTPDVIDAAVKYVFGVDTQLVADRTYYVIDAPNGLAAAGGWSKRRTLFGGDQMKETEDPLLDPSVDAARIRAFFVDPQWARRGLATSLYQTCADAARAAGFRKLELMATAPGEPFYEQLGFTVLERIELPLPNGVLHKMARMARDIAAPTSSRPE